MANEDETFAVRVDSTVGEVRVTVAGDVDLSSAQVLRDALTRALEMPAPLVVIDLARVPYLDSTGINCLFDAAVTARDRGAGLRVERAQSGVERVLRIAGVTDVIEVVSD